LSVVDPVQHHRNKLIERLRHQIALVNDAIRTYPAEMGVR